MIRNKHSQQNDSIQEEQFNHSNSRRQSILKESLSTEKENCRYETCQRISHHRYISNYDNNNASNLSHFKVDNLKQVRKNLKQDYTDQSVAQTPASKHSNLLTFKEMMSGSEAFYRSQNFERFGVGSQQSQHQKQIGYHRKVKPPTTVENLLYLNPVENKSISDYANPLITPCFFHNDESPIKTRQSQQQQLYDQVHFISDEQDEQQKLFCYDDGPSITELSSEDLKDGNELLFAFENQHKDDQFNMGSPLKSCDEEWCPSFQSLLNNALRYFSDSSYHIKPFSPQASSQSTDQQFLQDQISHLNDKLLTVQEILRQEQVEKSQMAQELAYLRGNSRQQDEKLFKMKEKIVERDSKIQSLQVQYQLLQQDYKKTKLRKEKNKKIVFDLFEMIKEDKNSDNENETQDIYYTQDTRITTKPPQNFQFSNTKVNMKQYYTKLGTQTERNSPRNYMEIKTTTESEGNHQGKIMMKGTANGFKHQRVNSYKNY